MAEGFWDRIRFVALLFVGILMLLFLRFPQGLFDWWPLWTAWFFGLLHSITALSDNPVLKEYEQTIGTLFLLSLGVLAVLLYLFFVSPAGA